MEITISNEELEHRKKDLLEIIKTTLDKDMCISTIKMLVEQFEEIQLCQKVLLKYGKVKQ